MATRKPKTPVLDGVDLIEFARQKALVEQKATEALAERVETIRNALTEMQAIVSATKVSVSVSELITEFEDARESLDPNTDWSSSSAYC